MPSKDAFAEAKKGTAELVVLSLLEDGPRHGYELAQLIADRSDGVLTFNFASLYATLYKLEARRWIRARWVEKAGQRRRRYYTISDEGRGVLIVQRKAWRELFKALNELGGLSHA